ncbi:hypothetical protein TcBrA4_0018650 [Trypanosoma cruzi]|nr:hypothetical protein TcBrA4_0018650 [Trypanosoma cruzi]
MVRRLREALASCSYRVAISWARGAVPIVLDWRGRRRRSRGLQRTRVRQTHPAPIRHTSAQLSSLGNMLADVHPLCAPRPIEEEEELDKDDRERNSRVNPLGASSDAPTDMAGPSVAVPLQKQKGVADKGRAAGEVRPRRGTTHSGSVSSSSVKKSGKKPLRGGFFSRICCTS